jgi:hypothetical protein
VTHFSDDLYLGNVGIGAQQPLGGPLWPGPSPSGYGFGPMGRVYIWDVVPIALSATGICLAQAIAAAGNAVINGARAVVQGDGSVAAVLDYDRRVTFVSSNVGDTTQTITFYGNDRYGQPLSWAGLVNGTTPVVVPKTFKQVTRVALSAALAGNLSVGFNDALGLPMFIADAGYVLSSKWSGAADAGAFVAGVTTTPSTSTGDVRGVYTPTSVADGVKRLVMAIAMTAAQVGPDATRESLAGKNQNLYVA